MVAAEASRGSGVGLADAGADFVLVSDGINAVAGHRIQADRDDRVDPDGRVGGHRAVGPFLAGRGHVFQNWDQGCRARAAEQRGTRP